MARKADKKIDTVGSSVPSTPDFQRINRWRMVTGLVAAAAGSMASQAALALSLGRVNVLSALGEPLRAEIDVPELSAEEASSLRLSLADAEAAKAAGLQYNPILAASSVRLVKRPSGSAYLSVTSDRPVTEPFMDMLLEANWATGRVMRGYTLLFDPAQAPAPAAVAVQPALMTSSLPASAPTPAPPAAEIVQAPAMPSSVVDARSTAPAAPVRQASRSNTLRVQRGDTAGAWAEQYLPSGVSLDQMLVAMLNANPDAFVENNVNRLKTGAVLDMGAAADAASATSADEARRMISAQAKDFNEFRRRLAASAPLAGTSASSRVSGGQVQASVTEPKPQASSPDKLTLSKPTASAASKEDALAKDKQAKASADRAAELSKNIQDLTKLSAGASSGAGAPDTPAGGTLAGASGAAATIAPTPAAAASAQAAAVPKPASVITPAPVAAPSGSFVDTIVEHPAALPGLGLLAAALGGLALWRIRKRRNEEEAGASSFVASQFSQTQSREALSSQAIDEAQPSATEAPSSSMIYSPSQLDAGDIDPVAEAEVYIAYGRDEQAEEILRSAIATQPANLPCYLTLLRIYSKKGDLAAFQKSARDLYRMSGGVGDEWVAASALGRDIDPGNPLYEHDTQHAVTPSSTPSTSIGASATGLATAAAPVTPSSVPNANHSAASTAPDFDFDLSDLSLDLAPQSVASPASNEADKALSTKLSVALEARELGDRASARTLAQDVANQATGELQARAKSLLKDLA